MSGPPHALVIGESLVDLVDGIPHPGGSPLNVAVGLARLGVHTSLHTALGRDWYGDLLVEHLAESGVTLTESSFTAAPTSVAEATRRADGETTYDFSLEWDPSFAPSHGFGWVHVGSLGALMTPGATVVDAMLEDADSSMSFDPNIRPSLLTRSDVVVSRVEQLVSMSGVVKASELDLAWLYPGVPIHTVIDRWAATGPDLVVVTRGEKGSTARCGDQVHVIEPDPTTVVDTIGAGDAFMSGLLASLLRSGFKDVAASLRFATRCAAITVARAGADPPWSSDVVPE